MRRPFLLQKLIVIDSPLINDSRNFINEVTHARIYWMMCSEKLQGESAARNYSPVEPNAITWETGNNEFKPRFPLILTWSRNGRDEREKENGESRKKRGSRILRRKVTLRLRPT